MAKPARFNKSIQYIEDHLDGAIDLEQAARVGFISLMQLYRDCYTYTGHSVKEYIRKRRLSNALSLMKCSDLTFAEIAYACGYSSQQALCRCVKSATSMTPLEYKKSEPCYYFPRFDSEAVRQITVAAETIPQTIRAKFYHPVLRGIEQQAICALRSLLPEYKGRIFGRDGQQRGSRFCYELSVEYEPAVLNKLRNSVFLEASVLPALSLTFAKTIVANDENEIGQAWNDLYINWLKTSMFAQDDESYFEEYIHRGGAMKKLALYLPVRKRADYDKISLKHCEGREFLVASRKGHNAEEEASRAVMKFLSEHRPEAIRTAREFYVAGNGMKYTCGVKVEPMLEPPLESGLEALRLAEGSYAVVESGCCSDSRIFEALLDAWIMENGFSKDNQPAFTIYETEGALEPEAVRMTVWIKLANVKKR